jgi:hypothetical protein
MPFLMLETERDHYAEPVEFEIRGQDITGLEIRMKPGSSISGVITMEDDDNTDRPPQMMLMVQGAKSDTDTGPGLPMTDFARTNVGPDGTFSIRGIAPGRVKFFGMDLRSFQPLNIARIERDGVPQTEGLDLRPSEHATGVRVVITIANAVIQGDVRIEGGKLPEDAILTVTISKADGGSDQIFSSNNDLELDKSMKFKFERLTPGTYNVTLTAVRDVAGEGPAKSVAPPVTETVTVQKGSTASVTLVLKVSA